jgi:hypothetical protein
MPSVLHLRCRATLVDWRWQRKLRAWRRAEFVARAEAESMRRLGRRLTREEKERVLRRHPADL